MLVPSSIRRRGLALVAAIGSTVVATACSDGGADPSSLAALVDDIPAELDDGAIVEYFNLDRLREETGDELADPIIESDTLFDVAAQDFVIGDPFRTEAQHMLEPRFPVALEQTTATLMYNGNLTITAADADELGDALREDGEADVQREQLDHWEVFRTEDGDGEIVPGYPFDQIAVASNGDYLAMSAESDAFDAILELEDGDALGDHEGIDEIAAAIDDAEPFAAVLDLGDPANYEVGADSLDLAPLAPWDRVGLASVYDGDADEYRLHVFLWHEDPDAVDLDDQATRLAARLEDSADCEVDETTVGAAIVEARCATDEPMMTQVWHGTRIDLVLWTADS